MAEHSSLTSSTPNCVEKLKYVWVPASLWSIVLSHETMPSTSQQFSERDPEASGAQNEEKAIRGDKRKSLRQDIQPTCLAPATQRTNTSGKRTITGAKIISQAGQVIKTSYSLYYEGYISQILRSHSHKKKSFKGYDTCYMLFFRELQHRATFEVSKIFLKLNISSNWQFYLCWERPDLLLFTMNQLFVKH